MKVVAEFKLLVAEQRYSLIMRWQGSGRMDCTKVQIFGNHSTATRLSNRAIYAGCGSLNWGAASALGRSGTEKSKSGVP